MFTSKLEINAITGTRHCTKLMHYFQGIYYYHYVCNLWIYFEIMQLLLKLRFSSLRQRSPLTILEILFGPLAYLLRNTFKFYAFKYLFDLSVLYESYSRNAACTHKLISTLLLFSYFIQLMYRYILMDTTQHDTNQNILVKHIGLWEGCRYVHYEICYLCWSWGLIFIYNIQVLYREIFHI